MSFSGTWIRSILRPYQLDDKTFVEYHTSPEASVTLYYSLDTGLGTVPDYKSEPLKNVYEGILPEHLHCFMEKPCDIISRQKMKPVYTKRKQKNIDHEPE